MTSEGKVVMNKENLDTFNICSKILIAIHNQSVHRSLGRSKIIQSINHRSRLRQHFLFLIKAYFIWKMF